MSEPIVNANKKIEFFANRTIGAEVYADKKGYTGTAIRFDTTIESNKFGELNVAPIINFNKRDRLEPTLSCTLSTPGIDFGKAGKTTFFGHLENETIFEFDNRFRNTGIINEQRGVFEINKGSWTASFAPSAIVSKQKPNIRFSGGMIAVEKEYGNLTPYLEAYLPKEAFKKGDFGATNFVAGVSYKF